LTAKSLSIISVSGFEIAGEDRKFVGADARIEGDTVVVSSDQVPHPDRRPLCVGHESAAQYL
jgi:hypothetical protein